MASKAECECVEKMMDTLVTASNLSKSASTILSRNPNIIMTDADLLKNEIEKLENHCAIPTRDTDISFFMEGRYKVAKDELEKTINSGGKDKNAAANAADKFYSFILDNGGRMIRCPKHKV